MPFPAYPVYQPSNTHVPPSKNWVRVTNRAPLFYRHSTHSYQLFPEIIPKQPIPQEYTIPKYTFGPFHFGKEIYKRPIEEHPRDLKIKVHNGSLNDSAISLNQESVRLLGKGSLDNTLAMVTHTQSRETISAEITGRLLPTLHESMENFPWILDSLKQRALQKMGIAVSNIGLREHPHPLHKSIEQHILFYHWRNLATEPSTVMFMKESKFLKLQALNGNFQELCNYHITAPDRARYPRPSTNLPSHSTLFMHDALMYFTPGNMVDLFERCPKLEVVYATLVVPPESDFTSYSLYPSWYTYHLQGTRLHYHPENHHAGSYTQPRSAIQWLKTSMINSENFDLAVYKLESWGPCHSIMIVKGVPLAHSTDNEVHFDTPEMVVLPNPKGFKIDERHRMVPYKVYESLFTYVRAVRTLRTTDPAGFVRIQQEKDEYDWVTSMAWEYLTTFALLTVGFRPVLFFDLLNTKWLRLKFAFNASCNEHPYLWSAPVVGGLMATGASTAFITTMPWYYNITYLSFLKIPLINQLAAQLLENTEEIPSTPWFSIKFARKLAEPPANKASEAALFLAKHPELSVWIKKKPISTGVIKYCLLGALAPLAAYGIYLLFKSDSSKEAFENYAEQMHPDKHTLKLKQEPVTALRETFLPGLNLINLETPSNLHKFQPPMLASKTIIPEAAPIQNTEPAEIPTRPIFPEYNHDSKSTLSSFGSSSQPAIPVTIANSILAQSFEKTASSPAIPEITITSATPRNSIDNGDSPPLLQAVKPIPKLIEVPIKHATTSKTKAFVKVQHHKDVNQTKKWLLEHAAPSHVEQVNEQVTNEVHSSSPISRTNNITSSSFDRDGSTTGFTLPFDQLYPGAWYEGSATFPCRRRIATPSKAPYPANKDCLLIAFSNQIGIPPKELWKTLCNMLPDSMLQNPEIEAEGLSTDHLSALCHFYCASATIYQECDPSRPVYYGLTDATVRVEINHQAGNSGRCGHFSSVKRPLTGGATFPNKYGSTALDFRHNQQLLPFLKVHKHTINIHRAKNLSGNLKYGNDGIMSVVNSDEPNSAKHKFFCLDQRVQFHQPRTVELIHLAGFAGCGKTLPVVHLLQHPNFRDFRVVVPTTELRSEWKKHLQLAQNNTWRVSTWESALVKNTASVLVIDEIYKLPRGYLDLALIADLRVQFVVLLGDPAQGEYHSTNTSSSNKALQSEIGYLSKYIDCYCLWSYRIPMHIAGVFGVDTYSKEPGYARHISTLPEHGTKILCNSHKALEVLTSVGHEATTISASQGSTFDEPVCIQLDADSLNISNSCAYVALTRSKKGVYLTGPEDIISGNANSNHLLSAAFKCFKIDFLSCFAHVLPQCMILRRPLTSRKQLKLTGKGHVNVNRLLTPHEILSRQPEFPSHYPKNPRIIADQFEKVFNSDYKDDVFLEAPIISGDGTDNTERVSTHFIPETRRPLHYDIPSSIPTTANCSEAMFSDTAHEPVYPGETFENLAAHFLPNNDPTLREIIYKDERTNQFPWINQSFELSAQPSSLISAQHNIKKDPTLLVASIEKRLRFRESEQPYHITAQDEILGSILYESLCHAYRRSPTFKEPFNEELFIRCINVNEYAQLSSKTQNVIAANHSRSAPDWRYTAVKIFAKTQHKVNEGTIFGNWKACQTLALMHDAVILILGPVKKYQRIFSERDRPPHLYVHAGHTPMQMSKWCQTHLRSKVKTTNDYTAFDQSQHGEAVVLERKKMECLSIPQHLINFHVWLKCNITTQFGPLTCMRLTGEPGTYDDNTDYNIAVINTEYVMGNIPYMVSGDDSMIDGVLIRNPSWPAVSKLLALQFKTEIVQYSLFCGYYVGPAGAVRAPRPLFAKIMIAVDDGSIKEKMLSYMAEFLVGHSLGERMWSLIHIDHIKYQSAVFDFFCRRAPTHLKIAFKLGEAPLSELLPLFGPIKWASYAVYSMLSSSARKLIIKQKHSRAMPETPEDSLLYTQLLESFQMTPRLTGGSPTLFSKLASNFTTSVPDVIPTTQMANVSASADVPLAVNDRIDRPLSLPKAPSVVETNTPHILIPFQYVASPINSDTDFHMTWTIDSTHELRVHLQHYRHAEIKHLEVEFVPTASSINYPYTVYTAWTIASVSPPARRQLEYYGGKAFTLGGSNASMGINHHVLADLRSINPVIKSSVTFNDTPRLTVSTNTPQHPTQAVLGHIVIRGKLLLSGPIGNTLRE